LNSGLSGGTWIDWGDGIVEQFDYLSSDDVDFEEIVNEIEAGGGDVDHVDFSQYFLHWHFHTYDTYGDYDIRLWSDSDAGRIALGQTIVSGDLSMDMPVFDSISGGGAFSLIRFVCGKNIDYIKPNAFSVAYRLVSADLSLYGFGSTVLFSGVFRNCYSLVDIKFPLSLTSIGAYAFDYCLSLRDVELPADLSEIGVRAFGNCYLLERVIFRSLIPPVGIGSYVFHYTKGFDGIIYVPDESLDLYLAESVKGGSYLAPVFGRPLILPVSALNRD
jgi:hypothetical protein